MSDCKHVNRTTDCVCNDCGYDLIVEPIAERYRQQERERIIKLLEEAKPQINPLVTWQYAIGTAICLIKGENK